MLVEDKKEDRRVRRTKKLLKHSFFQLLEEKNCDCITVKDIVEHADYNRATFYHHYKYKEELVEEITQEIILGLISNLCTPNHKNSHRIQSSDITIFHFIMDYKDFFKLWKSSDGIPGIKEKFLETLMKEFSSKRKDCCKQEYLHIIFHAYGIIGLITEWIKNDFSPSPESMAEECKHILNSYQQRTYTII